MSARRALIAALVCAPLVAAAQKGPADAEFKRGKQLMAAGKIAEACDAFDRSQSLDPSVSTMLNQGNCREKNGQLATARKLFTTAARDTDRSSDPKHVQLHNVALDRAAKLGDRVSTVTLDVPAASRVPGLTLKRGSDVIDPSDWGTAIQLDGGTYTFEATAPDHSPWTETITLGNEKDRKTLTVPALIAITKPVDMTNPGDVTPPVDRTKPADSTTPTKPGDAPHTSTTPSGPSTDTQPRGSRLPALVVGGAGVAIGITGILFHLSARSKYADAVAEGNDGKQYDLWQTANTHRRIGITGEIVGGVAIGVGVWLFVRAGKQERVTVQPSATPDGASVTVSGWF